MVIHNFFNQTFIASLNGVRVSNTPEIKVVFDNLDETNYSVKLHFKGTPNPIVFSLTNYPNYETTYMLLKESGKYILTLESKEKIVATTSMVPTNTVFPTKPAGPRILNDNDFSKTVSSVSRESSETSKMEMAKTLVKDVGLTSAQVTEILRAFALEKTKIEFAKFSYPKVTDRSFFYKVYDVFMQPASKKEVSEFVKNYK